MEISTGILSDTGRLLALFEVIERGGPLSQRDLSSALVISLGKANALVRMALELGYIAKCGNTRYKLTPQGFREMSRLRYHRMLYSIDWYKTTRRRVQENLLALIQEGVRRVAFFGAGDVAEVAYSVMEKLPLQLVAVVDDVHAGEGFHVLAISRTSDLTRFEFDRVVVTSFAPEDVIRAATTINGIPETKLYFFR